jgi:hypothetical protein
MAEGDTLTNAVVGALVSAVVGWFLPLGPLFGGIAAGYMQGGDRSEGAKVGAISGALGLIPALLVGALVVTVVGALFLGVGVGEFLAASFVTGFFVVVFVLGLAVYFVGLGAIGGYVGNYVRYDTDLGS